MPGPVPNIAEDATFIGVPKDYSVPASLGDLFQPGGSTAYASAGPGLARTLQSTGPNFPQYQTGSELDVTGLSVENIARLQTRLATAGLLGARTKFRVGIADAPTIAAYKKLLTYANRYAISAGDALDGLASHPVTNAADLAAGGDGKTLPKQISTSDPDYTDPATAHAIIREGFASREGRAPTDAEYADLLGSIHAGEGATAKRSVTTQHYDKAGNLVSHTTHSGGDAPSPDVVVDQATRTGKLGREANTKMVATDFYNAASQVIGAGS